MILDALKDSLIDSLKLIPFLFIAFLIIEIIEHKLNKKNLNIISNSGKIGPLIGGVLGIIPQCGFSVMATNLYITRIISLGTLVSIYLTTSDEMLPILISENVGINLILKILIVKLIIGIFWGFLIDFILRKKNKKLKVNYDICNDEHCHCNKNNILKSSVIHTIKIITFIFVITLILNLLMTNVNEDILSKLFLKNNIFSPFIASIIGMIPNCGSSVLLTELYLHDIISFSSIIAGLLTNSGIAFLILFKSNKNIKENIKILLLVYSIGVFSGLLIELFNILF